MRIHVISAAVALAASFGLSACGGGSSHSAAPAVAHYLVTPLVADTAGAVTLDANLVNAWGIAASPAGPFWVADNHSGVTTQYTTSGNTVVDDAFVVTVPLPGAATGGSPAGQVYNGVVANFMGDTFILSTEDGTIAGWQTGTSFTIRVDNSGAGAVYKGAAIATSGTAQFLYATNFNAGTVDVFDSTSYAPAGTFTDATVPSGFAPFGIATIGGNLFVTFAVQDGAKHDDVKGAGNGFVDVFSPAGVMLERLVSHGALDSPWGLALAPADFGVFSGALLVGNFGGGAINAYNKTTGALLGPLLAPGGTALAIDGLWGIAFGNDGAAGAHNQLFYTAGPSAESHGVFGRIDAVQ